MTAREVMTSDVVTVSADTPIREVAKLLLDRGISATPVVDDRGRPLGMVSEGDLIGRDETARMARQDWWLTLVAEGDAIHPDLLTRVQTAQGKARDVMSAPVVTIGEETAVGDIARLLAAHHIKRAPVVRDGRIVGIVSRADLLRAFTTEPKEGPPPTSRQGGGLLSGALAEFDHRFLHHDQPAEPLDPPASPAAGSPAATSPAATSPGQVQGDDFSAKDFRNLESGFGQKERQHREALGRAAEVERRGKVKALIDHHIFDDSWRTSLQRAREAAEHGDKEFMLLRFPSELCSDGGRAINVNEGTWPSTLRFDAAEAYLRWERDLQPRGFHMAAKVLDFPDGKPGDVGLFLTWGE